MKIEQRVEKKMGRASWGSVKGINVWWKREEGCIPVEECGIRWEMESVSWIEHPEWVG